MNLQVHCFEATNENQLSNAAVTPWLFVIIYYTKNLLMIKHSNHKTDEYETSATHRNWKTVQICLLGTRRKKKNTSQTKNKSKG